MSYTEKLSWGSKEVIIQRDHSPVEVKSAESQHIKLEKLNINDPKLKPGNYDRADGKVLPIYKAEGIRIDLSKRSKEPMNFWHRNMDADEVIFCHKGGIQWETELGNVSLGPGEMFVIPRGIAHRSFLPEPNTGDNIILELKINSSVEPLWGEQSGKPQSKS